MSTSDTIPYFVAYMALTPSGGRAKGHVVIGAPAVASTQEAGDLVNVIVQQVAAQQGCQPTELVLTALNPLVVPQS